MLPVFEDVDSQIGDGGLLSDAFASNKRVKEIIKRNTMSRAEILGSVFKACQTSTSVYQLAEDMKEMYKETALLNKVKVGRHIKIKSRVDIKTRKMNAMIDHSA